MGFLSLIWRSRKWLIGLVRRNTRSIRQAPCRIDRNSRVTSIRHYFVTTAGLVHLISCVSILFFLCYKWPLPAQSFHLNTLSITPSTSTLTPLGACVLPSIVLVDLSCCSAKEREPFLQLSVLECIAPDEVCPTFLTSRLLSDKASQILTAYIDTTFTLPGLRQQALKGAYLFVCGYSVCSPFSTNLLIGGKWWCPKKCGGACKLPTGGS